MLYGKGPAHAKWCEVCVEIGARRCKSSWGHAKKLAEQEAALEVLLELGAAQLGENGEIHLCRTPRLTDRLPQPSSPATNGS